MEFVLNDTAVNFTLNGEVRTDPSTDDGWILTTGFWNDEEYWDDEAYWND